jgi:general secretion pathway protein H
MASRVVKARMPISVLGHRAGTLARTRTVTARCRRGFTLIELLLVVAIVAISVGVVSLALRDSAASKLEEEAARLSALLDMARAEARAAGVTVRWVPTVQEAPGFSGDNEGTHFRFVGLPRSQPMPTHWLDANTRAELPSGASLLLGPEAILPPQRVVLRLRERSIELASDGLSAFAVAPAPDAAPAR